jgi:hypothetical protein
MTRRLVASREYKVMLLPERFAGSEQKSRRAVDAFWADAGRVLSEIDVPTDGSFDEVKAHRRIRFFDTAGRSLNRQRYIFRERIDVENGEREVTLKFRHADRYVAQDRDMGATVRGDDAETKFEEDVKPPFVSVFSFSTSVRIDAGRRFDRVKDIAELFPGLSPKLDDVAGRDALAVVGEFCARELVLVGASMLLGKRDRVAECAMVIWHHDDDVATPPICVEFSYKYGDDDEDYRGSVARDAHDALHALATRLPDWVHPQPATKTAFVYVD